jgi:hypothetical protein
MAVRQRLAAASPSVCSFVAADGMGGMAPSREEVVVAPGYGMGGTT